MRLTTTLFIASTLLAIACSDNNYGQPVVVVDGQPMVLLGVPGQFTATTTNSQDGAYTWTTSNDVIATCDPDGMVTGHASGEVTINATGQGTGVTGSVTIVVSADPNKEIPNFEDWSNSPHGDKTAEAFRHWDDDGEVSASCAKCHSTHGYRDFLGDDGTEEGVVNNPAELGSTVECNACHNVKATEKSTVTFPSGVTIDMLGAEANCMECHQGRESTKTIDDKIDAANPADDDEPLAGTGFVNIHYFPAGATRYGGEVKGGYLYESKGKAYDIYFRHVPGLETCQSCHEAHTQQIKLNVCAQCHNVTTHEDLKDIRMESSKTRDYDGDGNLIEGLWFEIDTLRGMLLTAIQNYARDLMAGPICYDSHSYPYFFKDNNDNGICDPDEANYGNKYSTFSARLLKATFNYQYSVKDPGGFAHNGKFIIQLCHDSIEDLNESSMAAKVDLSNADRNDSGHFNGTAEAFRHWDGDGEVSASCAKCHSASRGFGEYLTYKSNTAQRIENGFDCAVCHTTFDTFETRRITSVEFVSGKSTPTIPPTVPTDDPEVQANICITCHQGRTSGKDIDDSIAADKLKFLNIHYLAAAATLFGTDAMMGYQYAGKTYSGKFMHVAASPTNTNSGDFCHSPKKTKHTFHPEDNIGTCRTCHTLPNNELTDIRVNSTADYDGDDKFPGSPNGWESLEDEVATLSGLLFKAAQDHATNTLGKPICYDSHAYPYFFNDTNGNGICDNGEANYGNQYRAWDPKLMKAAHNYQHSLKEPGAWAHNFAYIVQLMIDSMEDLGHDLKNPVTGKVFVRPPS